MPCLSHRDAVGQFSDDPPAALDARDRFVDRVDPAFVVRFRFRYSAAFLIFLISIADVLSVISIPIDGNDYTRVNIICGGNLYSQVNIFSCRKRPRKVILTLAKNLSAD
jgi:hypothetical protein